jgi:protein-disulfide isomerase
MQRVDDIGSNDHVRGPEDAALTVIEYGDFQCPYCARAHAVLQELDGQFGGIRLVYRHLPLSDFHPLAEQAAEAAEAAGKQGKFWDMHDALFEQQTEIMAPDDLADLAETLGLDIERFRADVTGRSERQRVQADAAHATQQGLHRTPTFFINGVPYHGDSDAASLEQAFNAALGR